MTGTRSSSWSGNWIKRWPAISLKSWFGGNLAGEYQYALYKPVSLLPYWIIHWMADPATAAFFYSVLHLAVCSLGIFFLARAIGLRDGLAELGGRELDVVVGGLGLGYTAQAVLNHDAVRSMIVVEMLEAVAGWHKRGVLPLGTGLMEDPRCDFVADDFFRLAASADGLDPDLHERRFHAILVDIDHSPDELLDTRSTSLYQSDKLRRLAAHIHPGGVFGLWSNAQPDNSFTERLAAVFKGARAEQVTFYNPLQDRPFTQTVYVARSAGE